jgi:hypothetical protein
MVDRPIIFSAPMVAALLDGRKTQTRRVLKQQPDADSVRRVSGDWLWSNPDGDSGCVAVPYAPGDRLWVREAWRARLYNQNVPPRQIDPWATRLHYEADGLPPECDDGTNWDRLRSPIHMPRWASRLTLTVTDVRVQQLQEISEADAWAEGCAWSDLWEGFTPCPQSGDCRYFNSRSAVASFEQLWSGIHGPDVWDRNPVVSALTFTVERRNIDAVT